MNFMTPDASSNTMQPHPSQTEIHPAAIVAAGARIGENVRIGPWCSIGPEVTIGDGARLLSHVVVDGRVVMKDREFKTVDLQPMKARMMVRVASRHIRSTIGTTAVGGQTRNANVDE